MKKLAKQVGSAKKQTMGSKLSYIKKNWQLYVFFLMPALLLTIIFKYLPMGGLLIAFEDYNVIKGVLGSPWVGGLVGLVDAGITLSLEATFNKSGAWPPPAPSV